MDRYREINIDGQVYRKKDRWTGIQTKRQAETERQGGRQTSGLMDGGTNRQIEKRADGQTNKPKKRQTD